METESCISGAYFYLAGLSENHSGMETDNVVLHTYTSMLSENHSGMETPTESLISAPTSALSENHSGMETFYRYCDALNFVRVEREP